MNANVPVVLVHGLIGTFQVPDIVKYLPTNKAIALDLLGYGALGDVPPSKISISSQISRLIKLIGRQWVSEPVHLVGHSVGGVIAMLFAHAFPERVRSIVSVEGNFTLKDAFWTSSVARMIQSEVDQTLRDFRNDPEAWLSASGVSADTHTVEIARVWLNHQSGETLQAMAKSVVYVTRSPDYLRNVRSLFARHPVHLVAGERSSVGWDVPEWARREAASYNVISGTGHLMMLERPAEFAAVLMSLLYES